MKPVPWTRLTLFALILGGVVLRLALQSWSAADPLQGAPLLDTAAYLEAASAGGGLHGPSPPPYRPPGYVWLLRLTGFVSGETHHALPLQALLEGLTIWLVARVATRAAGRRAGLLAALFWCLSPSALTFSGELLEGSLAALLVAAASASAWSESESEDTSHCVRTGLLVGLAALVRPNLILLAIPLAMASAKRSHPRRAALLLLAAALPLLPGFAVNLAAGEAVPISANGGVNLYLGNVWDPELHRGIPYYESLPGPVAGLAWERLGKRAFDAVGPSPGAQSRWHARQALASMFAGPKAMGRTLVRFGKKLLALLDGYELSNNRDLHRPSSPLALPWFFLASWSVLLPLAWAGAAVFRKSAAGRTHLAALAWLVAGLLLFFVSARHRLPLLPLVIPLAAAGAVQLPRKRSLIVLAAIGAAFAWSDPLDHRALYQGYVIDPVGRGALHAATGRSAEARADFELALARDPRDGSAFEGLASLALTAGRLEQAAAAARKATRLTPGRASAWNQLGLAHGYAGRAREALVAFERGLELAPEDVNLLINRGRALLDLGRHTEARQDLEIALRRIPEGSDSAVVRRNVEALLDQLERSESR